MTKEFLDGPEVRPAVQQMGREGVPERVRMGLGQRRGARHGASRPAGQAPSDVRRRQAPAGFGEKQRRIAVTLGGQEWPGARQVALERHASVLADRNEAGLASLALY